MLKPCVFFDRDGIVNRYPGEGKYVERLEEFHLQSEFIDALRLVLARNYEAVIVTNQRGVALGKMTLETIHGMHGRLHETLSAENLKLLDIMICPHGEDSHPNRKPNPGMILDAAKKHGLDLHQSWMVGDSERDAVAGKRAGCKTVLVSTANKPTVADYRVKDMKELVAFLEAHL